MSANAYAQSPDAKCPAPFAALLSDKIFDRYPVVVSRSKPVPPHVLEGAAHTYRTVIRDQAREGPNFAGHYTLIQIGCGAATSCVAIADATTGRVYFPPNLRSASSLERDTGSFDLERLNYRIDSRLLIVAGVANEDEKTEGMTTYLWDGGKLRVLRSVPAATLCKTPRR